MGEVTVRQYAKLEASIERLKKEIEQQEYLIKTNQKGSFDLAFENYKQDHQDNLTKLTEMEDLLNSWG